MEQNQTALYEKIINNLNSQLSQATLNVSLLSAQLELANERIESLSAEHSNPDGEPLESTEAD